VLGTQMRRPRRALCHLFPARYDGTGELRGVTGREDVFAEAPFAACHASTLAETGAGLVAAWFGGRHEGHPGTAIWAAVRGEAGWSPTRKLVDGDGEACWNPVLWAEPDGPLHLYYKVGGSPRSWRGRAMYSEDGGLRWGAPADLPPGIVGPVKNKPVLLDGGRLISPSSTECAGWRVHFEWSDDRGRSWRKSAPPEVEGLEIIQPALLVHADGRLQALCRSRQGFVAETWSGDDGQSWSAPVLTDLPNPNSGFDAVTLADGRHLLVWNPVPRCRSPLVVSVSGNGHDWREVAVLEDRRGEFSYPAAIQAADGTVWISYTNRRERISIVTMDPAAI